MESHRAGSVGDKALANKIQRRFNEYGLTTWTDEHFVKVQEAPASGYNKFTFKDAVEEEHPQSFLSYSASKRLMVMKKMLSQIFSLTQKMVQSQKKHQVFCVLVQGPVLYAHYGEESDFNQLQKSNINMSDKVMLVRAGKISFAEKVGLPKRFLTCLDLRALYYHELFCLQQVANAAKVNAAAVLIYPDREDFNFEDSEDTTEFFGHVSVLYLLGCTAEVSSVPLGAKFFHHPRLVSYL